MFNLLMNNQLEAMAQQIFKTHERVVWLYSHFPHTVQSDEALLSAYEQLWGDIKFKEDVIKRAGRKLRHEHPDRYARTEEKRHKDALREGFYHYVYARS